MSARVTPLLHRDDPEKDPLVGHTKVTREDWLNVARDVLVSDGVAEVKVLALGTRLDVSRSSFYGYFKSRNDLLDALLDDWEERNTATIVKSCAREVASISQGICNFFACFLDPDQLDQGLDSAVRDWSRRDGRVRQRIDAADNARLDAIAAMFVRSGYSDYDADSRARILYFMQVGYHAVELREPIDARMMRLEGYVRGFSGADPDPAVLADFRAFVQALGLK